MDVQAQRGDELWTVTREGLGPVPIGSPATKAGEGYPLKVTRSNHPFDFPCEWRRDEQFGKPKSRIFTVEKIAERYEVTLALETLSRALVNAEALTREAERLDWQVPKGAYVLGEVLVVGEQRVVASFLLRELRMGPDAALRGMETSRVLEVHGQGAPAMLKLEGVPDAENHAYVVRRDGATLALSTEGRALVLTGLPDVALLPGDSQGIPGHAFCDTCNWPHPDRPTCP